MNTLNCVYLGSVLSLPDGVHSAEHVVLVHLLADNALESLIRGSLAHEQYEFCTVWTFLCALLFGVLFISLRVTLFVVCSSLFVLVVAVHVCHRMYKRQWTQERLRKSSAPGEKLWCW